MHHLTRRRFLKTLASAAATAAAAPLFATQDDEQRYAAAVLAEDGLLAYWRMEGDLNDAKSNTRGEVKGGALELIEGAVGGRAISLESGRFVTFGATPELDTPETTIELFFQVIAAPPPGYNPCIVAKRSAKETRWSIHVWQDLSRLAVWNGREVARIEPPAGPIRVGEWHHVAAVSRATELFVYLDGVACRITQGNGGLSVDARSLPLQIASSTPEGSEILSCAVDELAIYSRLLSPDAIARHVDAAGPVWAKRRKQLEDDRRRLEEERRLRHVRKMAERLKDPRLLARGETRVYRGEHLGAIRFGLGGIGTGLIQMNGKAELGVWQIFNNFTQASVPESFLAVRAKAAGGEPIVRALQTARVGPFEAMNSLSFRGEYPFAWFDFEDTGLPVKVTLEAFNPLVPLKTKESSIPCGIFNVTAENRGAGDVEVSFLAAQQNTVGFTGKGVILGRKHTEYGGHRSRLVRDKSATILHMTADRDASAPGSGSMALLALVGSGDATGTAAWPNAKALLEDFAGDGALTGVAEAGPSPRGETSSGALAVPFVLKPGEKRTATFALAWHFPNARHGGEIAGWEHAGNFYSTWWKDALDVARYLVNNLGVLADETRLFHRTLHESNLPRWLLDRVTSQTAVLRSKTCWWAADGYFGAWEGCAPESGCCAGNCTHVWHYAQSHARLFPDLARKMREETYGYQHPDGGLPHRHPSLHPAADGELGDILGAWREHLGSADASWLKGIWPRVKRAMEHAVKSWDPDEDGALAGAQWNTLDGALGGSTSWIGTLYLAALAACERMAKLQGEDDSARRYAEIREKGASKQNETLWNGEYYVQLRDAEPRQDYGSGCAIDQVLGEWWARQVGLETGYPADRVRSALASLLRHNFKPDFQGVTQVPRKFVDDADAGMQMIQWPKGPRPVPQILYGDEVMTGFEYAAAAAMVQHGMLKEGLLVALAVSDRYDGRERTGLTNAGTASWGYSGSPFGDDECGKFYARAMSVWSLLLACQGFRHDGPAGAIGFEPVWRPEDHASFFTTCEGWGLFTQKRDGGRQRSAIELRAGRLRLRELVIQAPGDFALPSLRITHAGRSLAARVRHEGKRLVLGLEAEVALTAGESLVVEVE